MAKRFTDSEKFRDKWYRRLPPMLKLGWDYLYHTCDAAGVIDLDEDQAEFEIGGTVEWDELLHVADHRVQVLPCGKWWLTGFIGFQYGELSEDCRAHRPAFKSLEKHKVQIGIPKVSERVSETLKDKDKEKDKDKDRGSAEGDELDRIESFNLRVAARSWVEYKSEKRQTYKPQGLKALVTTILSKANEQGEPATIADITGSMGDNYQGIVWGKYKSRGSPTTGGYRSQNVQAAMEFVNDD